MNKVLLEHSYTCLVNKVLLEHSYTCLSLYGHFYPIIAELSNYNRHQGPQILQYLLSGPLEKKMPNTTHGDNKATRNDQSLPNDHMKYKYHSTQTRDFGVVRWKRNRFLF